MIVNIIHKETGKMVIFYDVYNENESRTASVNSAWEYAIEDGIVSEDDKHLYKFSFNQV
jgi:hypothetical protein